MKNPKRFYALIAHCRTMGFVEELRELLTLTKCFSPSVQILVSVVFFKPTETSRMPLQYIFLYAIQHQNIYYYYSFRKI